MGRGYLSLRPLALASGLALALGAALAPHDVAACGGFFARESSRKPSLSYEQVLIVHDPVTEEEHFVREVAFRGGSVSFGFVVPTPSRPTVAKVEHSPFPRLRTSFPFHLEATIGGAGQVFGNGHGRLGGGVTVLDVSKVGSFTAFTLAAEDEKALAGWLGDNGFASTPEADVWLAHYVRMRFFYVAMRYDPPSKVDARPASTSVTSETLRISFKTPVPYYPYFEPRAQPLASGEMSPARLLELWVASPMEVTPIAARTVGTRTSWVRPMQQGLASIVPGEATAEVLRAALGDELHCLLPAGPLVVQTFQDQKYSREGYGDVLFAPANRSPPDPAKLDRLRPLLGILDPSLVPSRR